MPKEIVVDIYDDGQIEVEGEGFKGMECDKAMNFLERCLGTIKKKKYKAERWIKDRVSRLNIGR